MPALLTSASIDLKRASAVSTILAAVAGSPMWPSTRATWSVAATCVDWVTFRELATTLNPRSTTPLTIPAPIPCEAPVTMAVFGESLMIVYLENVLSVDQSDQKSASITMRQRALPDSAYSLGLSSSCNCRGASASSGLGGGLLHRGSVRCSARIIARVFVRLRSRATVVPDLRRSEVVGSKARRGGGPWGTTGCACSRAISLCSRHTAV